MKKLDLHHKSNLLNLYLVGKTGNKTKIPSSFFKIIIPDTNEIISKFGMRGYNSYKIILIAMKVAL